MRSIVVSILFLCGVLSFAAPAWAAIRQDDEPVVMSDAEMDDLRGGFSVAGLDIGFGAVVTTYISGQPALTTSLTWSDAGQTVQQEIGNAGQQIQNLTPDALNALGLKGVAGSTGVVINDANGVTALIHNVTDGALQNIIVNSASNRDLRQDIDITLVMPGFTPAQDAIGLQQFGMRLNSDMAGVAFGG